MLNQAVIIIASLIPARRLLSRMILCLDEYHLYTDHITGSRKPFKLSTSGGMQHGPCQLGKETVSIYQTLIDSLLTIQARSLPPYVEILVTHTQLSTYGGVINHRTAPIEVKRFFRAAGLSSALNVLRAAIQGESRLKSMPNNTVIMISFAACSALSLSVTPGDSKSSLAPSVRNLIEETAGVLERIGATPSHRSGASVLYGRFLRELIRRAPAFPLQSRGNLGEVHPSEAFQSACLDDRPLPVAIPEDLWFEPLQFSAMSDDQIVDAVNRAGTAFGASIPDVPLDDMLNWDWLDSANADFNLQ